MQVFNLRRLFKQWFSALKGLGIAGAFVFGAEMHGGLTSSQKVSPLFEPETVAIRIDDAEISFFELAQILDLSPCQQKKDVTTLESTSTEELLAPIVQETVEAAIGIHLGFTNTDDYYSRSKAVQKNMLWQDFSTGIKLLKQHKLNFEENGDCIIELEFTVWKELSNHLQLLAKFSGSAEDIRFPLLIHTDGNLVAQLNQAISKHLKQAPRERLEPFINFDLNRQSSLLRWYLGEQSGAYSVGAFIDDYNNMPIRKESYSHQRLSQLVVENFLMAEFYERAISTGLVSEKSLELGFPTYTRRYAKNKLREKISDEIPLPSAETLKAFFHQHSAEFSTPTELHVMDYHIKTSNQESAVNQFLKVINAPTERTEADTDEPPPIGHEIQILPSDPRFKDLVHLPPGKTTPLKRTPSGEYFFSVKISNMGSRVPPYEEVKRYVEARWRKEKVAEEAEKIRSEFLKEHFVTMHPMIDEFICSPAFESMKIVRSGHGNGHASEGQSG